MNARRVPAATRGAARTGTVAVLFLTISVLLGGCTPLASGTGARAPSVAPLAATSPADGAASAVGGAIGSTAIRSAEPAAPDVAAISQPFPSPPVVTALLTPRQPSGILAATRVGKAYVAGGWYASDYSAPEHPAVWTSPDGRAWTRRPIDGSLLRFEVVSLASDGHRVVAVGRPIRAADTRRSVVWSSDDLGLTWRRVSLGAAAYRARTKPEAITWSPDRGWLLITSHPYATWLSADGRTWSGGRPAGTDQLFTAIPYGPPRLFPTMGGSTIWAPEGSPRLYRLSGANWRVVEDLPTRPVARLNAVAMADLRPTQVIVVGSDRYGSGFWRSTDGQRFVEASGPVLDGEAVQPFVGASFVDGRFVVIGSSGIHERVVVARTSDFATWQVAGLDLQPRPSIGWPSVDAVLVGPDRGSLLLLGTVALEPLSAAAIWEVRLGP